MAFKIITFTQRRENETLKTSISKEKIYLAKAAVLLKPKILVLLCIPLDDNCIDSQFSRAKFVFVCCFEFVAGLKFSLQLS